MSNFLGHFKRFRLNKICVHNSVYGTQVQLSLIIDEDWQVLMRHEIVEYFEKGRPQLWHMHYFVDARGNSFDLVCVKVSYLCVVILCCHAIEEDTRCETFFSLDNLLADSLLDTLLK